MKLLRLSLFAALCCTLSGGTATAQSIEHAQTAYRTFLQLNDEKGDAEAMYDALYRSYDAYADLLRTSPETPMATEAKTALRNIRPYLQNGAVYYSQKGVKQQAVRLARAYVDIPLMEAFRGEHFIKDEYYPTMVYFAAAESYNARDYAAAVRYFREYLQSGASDKRKEVYTYMSKSCVNIKNN